MAHFPKIEYCIICEDLRPEIGNKFTILGFFGVAPVDVLVAALNQPLKLMFLFGARSVLPGTLRIAANLLGPGSSHLASGGILEVQIAPGSGDRVVFGMGFQFQVQHEGKHTVQILSEGNVQAEANFEIRLQSSAQTAPVIAPHSLIH